ncbi:MAG: hypothetical protein V1936_02315 [Patescibacteria group bacterium]
MPEMQPIPTESNVQPVAAPTSASPQPQAAAPAPASVQPQPVASATAATSVPAPLSFFQKVLLFKKKYDYVNGKGLDSVAAEEAARKDLGLPEMTEAERVSAAQPNILQKILSNKIVIALGITEFFNRKKTEVQTNLKAKVDAKLGIKPAENPIQPVAVAPVQSAQAEQNKTLATK